MLSEKHWLQKDSHTAGETYQEREFVPFIFFFFSTGLEGDGTEGLQIQN